MLNFQLSHVFPGDGRVREADGRTHILVGSGLATPLAIPISQ